MAESPDMSVPWWILGWWVCPAGTVVGGFFGSPFGFPGIAFGAVGGIVAGVLWSYWMSRRIRDPRPCYGVCDGSVCICRMAAVLLC